MRLTGRLFRWHIPIRVNNSYLTWGNAREPVYRPYKLPLKQKNPALRRDALIKYH